MEIIDNGDIDNTSTVYLDKDDICMWCECQYGCPLIECLSNGLVEAVSDIRVKECAHYQRFDVI